MDPRDPWDWDQIYDPFDYPEETFDLPDYDYEYYNPWDWEDPESYEDEDLEP